MMLHSTSQLIPAQGQAWSKNRRKMAPGAKKSAEKTACCGEGHFQPRIKTFISNNLRNRKRLPVLGNRASQATASPSDRLISRNWFFGGGWLEVVAGEGVA